MSLRSLLTVSCLLATSAAQESQPTAVARVRFTHPHALDLLREYGAEDVDQASNLEPGYHAEATLDGTLKVGKVTVVKGPAPAMELVLDPNALINAVPSKELAATRRRFEAAVKLGTSAFNLDPKEATRLAGALWEFPRQVGELRLVVDMGDAPVPGKVTVWITPKENTAFALMLRSVKPLPGGAPVLDAGGAVVSGRIALAMEPLDPWVNGLMRWTSTLLLKDETQRKQMLEYSQRLAGVLTGDMAMVMGQGGMSMLYSGRDPKVLAEFAASELMGTAWHLMEDSSFVESADYAPRFLEHRGVTVARGEQTVKKSMAANNPFLGPDGKSVQLIAAAREWMVSAPTAEGVRALIDLALDRKIKRVPMAPGEFMEMNCDMAAMLAAMPAPVALPFTRMAFTLGQENGALRLGVRWE